MTNQHSIYDSCQKWVKVLQLLSVFENNIYFFNSFEHNSTVRSRTESLEENSSSNYPDYFAECVKKEAITPPGSIKNNNNTNQFKNNKNDSEGSSILKMKTEPIGNPDSPESSVDHSHHTISNDDCAGCGQLIQVKNDLKLNWHATLPMQWKIFYNCRFYMSCAITDHLV